MIDFVKGEDDDIAYDEFVKEAKGSLTNEEIGYLKQWCYEGFKESGEAGILLPIQKVDMHTRYWIGKLIEERKKGQTD